MIVTMLQRFFAPLTLAFESRAGAMVLLEDLGWTMDETFELDALEHLAPVQEGLLAFADAIAQYDPEDPDVGVIIEQAVFLAGDINAAISALSEIAASDVTDLVSPLNDEAFWQELALDLPEHLILTYLRLYAAPVFAYLYFGGAIIKEERPDGRPPRDTLDWDALGQLLGNPSDQIRGFYQWGGEFDHGEFIDRFAVVLKALGLPVFERSVPTAIEEARFGGSAGSASALALPLMDHFRALSFGEDDDSARPKVGAALEVIVAPVPPESAPSDPPSGLLLSFAGYGDAVFGAAINDDWRVSTSATLDLSGLFGVDVQPDHVALASGVPAGELGLTLIGAPQEPWTLLGEAGKSRLELADVSVSSDLEASASGAHMSAGVALDGLEIVVCAGDGDGFISDVLEGKEVRVPISIGLEYDTAEGLRFNGGIGLALTLSIDKRLGPAHLQTLELTAGVEASAETANGATFGAHTSVGLSGSLTIGPFTAVLGGIGVEARFTPKERGAAGRGGAIEAQVGFKPPTSVGLSVEAPGVSGGGFLKIDRDAGQYAGILELKLFGFEVTAIGMIATKLPSGEEGWSLFLSISVIFPKAIPLSFGFSLSGIGGLVGVHRAIDVEALGEAVRSGNLDSVLFPQDAVANAPLILATLDEIFPSQKGQFAFGPMFQISWGAKGLVTLQLGVAIQLPDPVSISLLGSFMLRIGLPEKPPVGVPSTGEEERETDIIRLRVDVVGTLVPEQGKLSIDAAITEGFIAGLNLSGDMAVRIELMNRPNMVVSFGGFHPDFTAPEGFPALNRLALRIFDEPNLKVGVEAYFALAPNALQFGVGAYFFGKAIGLIAEGSFEFDTIIIFKPFGFEARLGFQVGIRAGSVELLQVRLRGTLTGPKPWSVTGYAEFKLGPAKKKFRVELTLGRAVSSDPREPVALFDLVREALEEEEAWAAIETGGALFEAVRYAIPEGSALYHPAGGVEVNQGIAPLGVALERYGAGTLSSEEREVSLGQVSLGTEPVASNVSRNWFAPSHFFDLTEEEKVSLPSFEELESGVQFGEGGVEFAPADAFDLGYETILVDPDVEAKWPKETPETSPPAMALDLNTPKADLGLDLVASKGHGVQVKTVDFEVVTTGSDAVAFDSASAALGAQRAVVGAGGSAMIRPTYERDMEEL